MQIKQLAMGNKEGLNAANAARFVKVAGGFTSRIHVEKGNKKVDAKSIMGMLSLGVKYQDTLLIFIDGEDEKDAAAAIEKLFTSKFAL